MTSMRRLLSLLMLAIWPAVAAMAVEPDEMLADPVLETRARAISAELRCVVCRSESIDESNAEIAKDLRLLVRERLEAGDTDDEVRDFIVDRYGEYILLRPPFTLQNAVLWLSGPVFLLIGGGIAASLIRRRSAAWSDVPRPLDEGERRRLRSLRTED
jgi:cytochrome c-type biogenesis protein CcmH